MIMRACVRVCVSVVFMGEPWMITLVQDFVDDEGMYVLEIHGLGNGVVMLAVGKGAPDAFCSFRHAEQL